MKSDRPESSKAWPSVHCEEFLPSIHPWHLFGWLLLSLTLGAGVAWVTFMPESVKRMPAIDPSNQSMQERFIDEP